MPIHEYACRDCQRDFEMLVRHDTVLQCPGCQSTALERRLSVFATAGSTSEQAAPMAAGGFGPCGTCGHPDGPGSCAVH